MSLIIANNLRGLNANYGTQISKKNTASGNMSRQDIHQVTAGKTFYFCGFTLSLLQGGADFVYGYLQVCNNADVPQYNLADIGSVTGTANTHGVTFSALKIPPIMVQSTWIISLYSMGNNCQFTAHINGWEE